MQPTCFSHNSSYNGTVLHIYLLCLADTIRTTLLKRFTVSQPAQKVTGALLRENIYLEVLPLLT